MAKLFANLTSSPKGRMKIARRFNGGDGIYINRVPARGRLNLLFNPVILQDHRNTANIRSSAKS
jgi:hypothetical protein